MRASPWIVLLACALAPAAGHAQPSTAAPSPSHLEAARELMVVLNVQEMVMTGVVVAMDEQIAAAPELAEMRGVMIEWAQELFSSQEATDGFARIYADALSESDLREIAAFYRTPAGQRMVAAQVTLMLEGAALGQRLAESGEMDLMDRLEAAFDQD